ncbi:helix-turn-helix domain-containing protein [Nocardia sp. NPDC003345]
MADDTHLRELGDFLRARRDALTPRDAGLAEGPTPRRVPGLRREEVAGLAAISTDYYTRIEQGRITASGPVLDTLARVLHLDADQRGYLHELSGRAPARPRQRARQRIQPTLQRLLDDLQFVPGLVLGRRMDILAWNSPAATLLTDFARIPERHRNYLRLVFTDPALRALYADWETVARTCVAQLRMEAAQRPDDPQLAALVGELSVCDDHFRRWWAAHHVATRRIGTKTLHHPLVGELSLDWDTLTCAADPEQQLITWTAAPDTPTSDRLRILASWTAEHPCSPSDPRPGPTVHQKGIHGQ